MVPSEPSKVELEVIYRGKEVIANCMGIKVVTSPMDSGDVIQRDGFLFFFTHRTRALISPIQVLDLQSNR